MKSSSLLASEISNLSVQMGSFPWREIRPRGKKKKKKKGISWCNLLSPTLIVTKPATYLRLSSEFLLKEPASVNLCHVPVKNSMNASVIAVATLQEEEL